MRKIVAVATFAAMTMLGTIAAGTAHQARTQTWAAGLRQHAPSAHRPAEGLTGGPADNPAEQPADESSQELPEQSDHPTDQSAQQRTESARESTEPPAGQPAEKGAQPVEQAAEQPVGQPAQQPAGAPTAQPAEPTTPPVPTTPPMPQPTTQPAPPTEGPTWQPGEQPGQRRWQPEQPSQAKGGEGAAPEQRVEVSKAQFTVLFGQCRYADTPAERWQCQQRVRQKYLIGARDPFLDCRTYSSVSVCGELVLNEAERACVQESVKGGLTYRRAEVECYAFR